MTRKGSFGGVLTKLAHANDQLDILYTKLLVALDSNRHPVRVEVDAKPHPGPPGETRECVAFTAYVSDAPSFGDDIGLLLGDVLGHYRGTLDHLVWQLVSRSGNRLSASQARSVAFPMARTRTFFWERARKTMPHLTTERTIIETYQPYRRSAAGWAMRTLRNLSDIGKHRFIIPSAGMAQTGDIKFDYVGALVQPPEVHFKFGRETKRGTKLVTMVLAGAKGQRGMGVEGYVETLPVFLRSLVPPPAGMDAVAVEWALSEIRDTCTEIVSRLTADN